VLPTATGTVTANTALEGMGPLGSDSTTTEIIAGSSSADLTAAVADSADPVALGDTYTYTTTVTNNGTSDATGVTTDITLSGTTNTITAATPSQGTCTIMARLPHSG
jgi:uncharacterized repeat protein (TIGR01451 family)